MPKRPSILYANRGKESVFTSNKYDTIYKYNYACQNGLVEVKKVLKVLESLFALLSKFIYRYVFEQVGLEIFWDFCRQVSLDKHKYIVNHDFLLS